MIMDEEQTTPCANFLFCCKENCLQRCETIKQDLDVIKEGFIVGNAFDVFCIKYKDITTKLKEIEDDFRKRKNNYEIKEDILKKIESRKEIIQDNRTTNAFRKVIVIIALVIIQFFLIYMKNDYFRNNMLGAVLICIIISAILIVQMVLVIEMVLLHYKYNLIVNKLEMLILKAEMSKSNSYTDIERELQLIIKLWDKTGKLWDKAGI